jgi:hypothetical protein
MESMALNLVVVPMEGMSQILFWQYRTAIPVLWAFSCRSLMFRRFYSSSTSTFQSFCDLLHGSSAELDHNPAFPSEAGCLLGQARNLFDILHEKNYATLGILHAERKPDYLKDNCLGVWPGSCGEFRWHNRYDRFRAESLDFIAESYGNGKSFALYYWDKASAVSDDCAEKKEAQLFHQRFRKGFSLLDRSVEALMEKLAALSLLDDTLIVFYGSHGMDPWRHGIAAGRTDAIEPYADLSWTPLFLYCNGRNSRSLLDIASSIDVKATLLGILFPGEQFHESGSDFAGINLLSMGRSAAFSQNLFALERENEGPSRGLAKSYAVTDGDQRLVVSSDGGIPGEGGMELFYDVRDPGNTRNLLDFFELNDEGIMTSFGRSDIIHPHFTQSFKPNLVHSVVNSYNKMRELLMTLVRKKELDAVSNCPQKAGKLLFQESCFAVKRRRRW